MCKIYVRCYKWRWLGNHGWLCFTQVLPALFQGIWHNCTSLPTPLIWGWTTWLVLPVQVWVIASRWKTFKVTVRLSIISFSVSSFDSCVLDGACTGSLGLWASGMPRQPVTDKLLQWEINLCGSKLLRFAGCNVQVCNPVALWYILSLQGKQLHHRGSTKFF